MAQTELKRQIGLFDAVMLISGDMIGTGIFISTGVIAAKCYRREACFWFGSWPACWL